VLVGGLHAALQSSAGGHHRQGQSQQVKGKGATAAERRGRRAPRRVAVVRQPATALQLATLNALYGP
jgi:hypothetical protein